MAYRELKGNLFNSKAQALVNTVNCVGVMGKGVALEFRLRFPDMFEEYKEVCQQGQLRPGQILPYRRSKPWVLNFAVKDHWKYPSRYEWVEACLRRFQEQYRRLGVRSVAFPWIGAMNGGLDWPRVHALMRRYLRPLSDIDIEVIEFDPDIPDPLFDRLEQTVSALDPTAFSALVGLQGRVGKLVCEAIKVHRVPSISRLCEHPGIGHQTIEKIYAAFRDNSRNHGPLDAVVTQPSLFGEL